MKGNNKPQRRWKGDLTAMLALVFSLTSAAFPTFAEVKVFEREYTYQASEADSKLSSRTISLAEVKRLLLEELGTYLESVTEVKNFQLTKDQITALTASIVRVEVLDERWDGKTYWFKAKIAADPHDVIKSIDALRKDREKARELEEVRKRADALLAENKRLKEELETAKGAEKAKKQEEYIKGIDALDATGWLEKGLSLYEPGKYKDAVEAYTKAISLNHKYAEAYNNRGNAYANLGNYPQAIKDYNKAIELDPKDAAAYYNRVLAYYQLRNYKRAISDYKIAARLGDEDAQNWLRKNGYDW